MVTLDCHRAALVVFACVVGSVSELEAAQPGSLVVTVEVVASCRIDTPQGTSELVACPARTPARAGSRRTAAPLRGAGMEPNTPLAVMREAGYLTWIY